MKIVFLAYINRSGSTYLMNQLSKSVDICTCPEADILYDLLLSNPHCPVKNLRSLLHKIDSNTKWNNWRTPLRNLRFDSGTRLELFCRIICLFKSKHFPLAKIIVFKHPKLLNLIDKIESKENFSWVILIRNPFANYSSLKTTISPATKKVMSKNPLAFSDEWNNMYEILQSSEKTAKTTSVQYELLIGNLNKEMTRIFSFLNVTLAWSEVKNNSGTLDHWLDNDYKEIHTHINQEPQTNSLDKWKSILTETDIQILKKKIKTNSFYEISKNENLSYSTYFYMIIYRIGRKTSFLKKKTRNLISHV